MKDNGRIVYHTQQCESKSMIGICSVKITVLYKVALS